jgi:tocopherol cyclase
LQGLRVRSFYLAWFCAELTPAAFLGPLERLGRVLPIHWHVFSTASAATWRLTRRAPSSPFVDAPLSTPPQTADAVVASSRATAHLEQNHGVGFPTGWIWAHSLSPSSARTFPSSPSGTSSLASGTTPREKHPIRFATAGGRILGLEAYLFGFRDDELGISWDFAPPWSAGVGGYRGLGLRTERDWAGRRVRLEVGDWARWAVVEMRAPPETFIPIPGPLDKGFAPGLCHQSFQARFTITLYARRLGFSVWDPRTWVSAEEWRWREVARYEVEEAALEFGAGYVGEEVRGTKAHGE